MSKKDKKLYAIEIETRDRVPMFVQSVDGVKKMDIIFTEDIELAYTIPSDDDEYMCEIIHHLHKMKEVKKVFVLEVSAREILSSTEYKKKPKVV